MKILKSINGMETEKRRASKAKLGSIEIYRRAPLDNSSGVVDSVLASYARDLGSNTRREAHCLCLGVEKLTTLLVKGSFQSKVL